MDREKVIQELDDSIKNQHCGFVDGVGDVYAVSEETIRNALALLKDEKEYCDKCAESAIKTTVELQEEIARLRSLLKEQEHKDRMFHALEDDWKRLKELLKEQEAVVRCKDCKHWYFADNRIPSEQENVCGRNGIVVAPDWFCADGVKKDD